MGATTEKVYSIKLEMQQAQQALDAGVKSLADFKAKATAANTELKESKTQYEENATELKKLISEQKGLEAAKKSASAGAPALQANANLDKNLAQQKQLNSIVQESKIDFDNAKAAAEAAGKAVGEQATTVEGLQESVKGYGSAAAAAALEFAPGTFGAIGKEIEQLKADLTNLVPGSAEAGAAIQALADKQSSLRQLANATAAANPRAQARAFGVLTQALVGTVGIATTAGEVFGLSEQTAQKYTQTMQQLTGVLYSVESINKLLNKENVSLISSIVSSGKAWFGAAEGASFFGKASRTALAASGIGVILLVLGALVALWQDLGSTVKGSESQFTQYKATVVGGLNGILAAGKDYLKFWLQVFTLDFSGAANTAKNAGKDIASAYAKARAGVIDEARRAELAHEVEQTARYVEIIKSRGEDTLALEVANARRKIDAEKANSKEQLDAVKDYLVLKNQYLKRQDEEEKALALARLDGLEKIEAANGRAVIEQQRAVLDKKLQDQIEADALLGKTESAAHTQILTEIQALDDAYGVEQTQKRRAAELARLDAIISLRAAKGQEAYAQEVARAERELQFLKSAAQRDEAAIIAAEAKRNDLIAARAYELTQRRQALKLAELDAIISLENVKGQESYQDQIKREQQQLTYLEQAGTRNEAAIRTQKSKITNLEAAYALKEAADERAADLARLNARIALMQALGNQTIDLQVQLKQKELAALLAAANRNEAAIITKQGEIDALITQQAVDDIEKQRSLKVEAFENEMTLLEKHGKDTLLLRLKFAKEQVAQDTDTSEKGLAQLRADTQKVKELEADLSERGPDIGGAILQKIFNVAPEDVQKVKANLNDAFTEIGTAISSSLNTYFSAGTAEAEAQMQAAQDKLSAIDTQLSAASSKRQSDEEALQTATGAKRDYLIGKINAEKAAEQKLAGEKAKAAREQAAAQQEKAKLDKQQQQITAASTAAEALLLAIRAAAEVVDIASKGHFGVDNIALAIAGAATIAASIFAVKNAAKQFDSGGVVGEDGVLRGPRHSGGGIPFTVAGKPGFEAEGGEHLTPVDATQKNGPLLQLLRTEGRSRTLGPLDMLRLASSTQGVVASVRPTPKAYFESGGILNKGGTPGGQASAADVSGLRAEMQRNNALMAQLVESGNVTAGATTAAAQHAATTAQATATTAAYGPPRIVRSHQEVLDDQQLLQEVYNARASATL